MLKNEIEQKSNTNKVMLFLYGLLLIVVASLSFVFGQKTIEDDLYRSIDVSEDRGARTLAMQYPDVLQKYYDEVESQDRKLTRLEYLAFNYYKNMSMFHESKQNSEKVEKEDKSTP